MMVLLVYLSMVTAYSHKTITIIFMGMIIYFRRKLMPTLSCNIIDCMKSLSFPTKLIFHIPVNIFKYTTTLLPIILVMLLKLILHVPVHLVVAFIPSLVRLFR